MVKQKKTVNQSPKQQEATIKKIPKNKSHIEFVFSKEKYIIMLIGLALIFIGFLLMIGGGTNDPNEFSTDLFNTRRLTIAPLIVLLGYGLEIYAIMKVPKRVNESETEE